MFGTEADYLTRDPSCGQLHKERLAGPADDEDTRTKENDVSKANGQVWLLVTAHDDQVDDHADVDDLLQPGRAYTTEDAAKAAAKVEHEAHEADANKERDAEYADDLERRLKLARSEKARTEIRHTEKWSSPAGIHTSSPLVWESVEGGVYATADGTHWAVYALAVQQ